MNNNAAFRRLMAFSIGGVILLGIVATLWHILFVQPFVTAVLPSGAKTLQLTNTATNITTTVTKTGLATLRTGSYAVTAYNTSQQAIGFTQAKVHPGIGQKIKGITTAPTSSLYTIMHRHAAMVAPLGNGYLYVDATTRGVFYTDTKSTIDVSSRFLLAQIDPSDRQSFSGTYGTVINLYSIQTDEAVLVTTQAAYIVKSPTDIENLPYSAKELLNFTSSSYDAQAQRLYLLSAYQKQIYYYDLRTMSGPKVLATAPLTINRIIANGNKVLVYYDAVPSLESTVVSAYAKNRQLTPLLIDATTGKTIRKFSNISVATQASISDNGDYLAIKQKFATTMTVYNLSDNTSFTTLAPDTNAYSWKNNILYFGRGNSLLSVDPSKKMASVTIAATSDAPLLQITATSDTLFAVSNTYYVTELLSHKSDTAFIKALRSSTLTSDDYFIDFTTDTEQTAANIEIETAGDTSTGFSDIAIANSETTQYQKGQTAIADILTYPNISVTQKDTSDKTPYKATLIPTDGDSE